MSALRGQARPAERLSGVHSFHRSPEEGLWYAVRSGYSGATPGAGIHLGLGPLNPFVL